MKVISDEKDLKPCPFCGAAVVELLEALEKVV